MEITIKLDITHSLKHFLEKLLMTKPTDYDLLVSINNTLNSLVSADSAINISGLATQLTGLQATANQILALEQPTPPSPPVLVSITPTTDTTAGGATITATGSNFLGTTGVMVGSVAATNVNVINDTTLTFTDPAQGAGVENVTLIAPGGTSAVVAGAAVTITAVAPTTTTAAIHNINVADTSVSATGAGLFTPGVFTINGVSVTVNPNDSLATISASTQAALQVANHTGASVNTADSPGNFNLTVVDSSTATGAGFAGAAVAGLNVIAPVFS